MTGRWAPVNGANLRIPWEVHEQAWAGYHARFPTVRQDAERIAERGGFGEGELDDWAPGWRRSAEPRRLDAPRARRLP